MRNIHPKQAWLSEPGPKMILKNIQIEQELTIERLKIERLPGENVKNSLIHTKIFLNL